MKELYAHRARLRKERGCIDFESGEVKLILDENGHCIDVKKRTSGESEAMIEEFMLLANQCAANAGRTNKAPFVYRVHEAPDAEKMEKLSATLLACGLNAKFKNPIPTQLELAAPAGRDPRPAHPDPRPHRHSAQHAEGPLRPAALATTVWCWRTTPTLPAPSAATLIWRFIVF